METLVSRCIKTSLEVIYKIISFSIKLWIVPLNSILEWIFERVVPIVLPLFNWLRQNKSNILKLSFYSILLVLIASTLTTSSLLFIYSNRVSKASSESPLYFDFGNIKKNQVSASTDITAELYKNRLYNVYLELELPESPKNIDMGMFMVCLAINNNDKWAPNIIQNYCKPTMLKFSSQSLKSIKNYVNIVPYLLGLYEEKQTIMIPMVENLLSTRYYHTITIDVSVMNPEIQIYSAKVKIVANLQGLEYFIYHYPITMFVLGYCALFFIWYFGLLFVVACVYLYRYFNRRRDPRLDELDESSIDSDDYSIDNVINEPDDLINQDDEPNDFFENGDLQPNPLSNSSSSSKRFVWEKLNEVEIQIKTTTNFVNNNNNNNSIYKDDDINEFLKREQIKYEDEQKKKATMVEPTIIVDDPTITSPPLNEDTSNATQQPQAINDDDLTSSSSTISEFSSSSFSPIVPSDNEDSQSNNNNNNDKDSQPPTIIRKRK